MCVGETDRCHHVEGKIFCEDDFVLSGHSRSYKSCRECGGLVTNKMVQVSSQIKTRQE